MRSGPIEQGRTGGGGNYVPQILSSSGNITNLGISFASARVYYDLWICQSFADTMNCIVMKMIVCIYEDLPRLPKLRASWVPLSARTSSRPDSQNLHSTTKIKNRWVSFKHDYLPFTIWPHFLGSFSYPRGFPRVRVFRLFGLRVHLRIMWEL